MRRWLAVSGGLLAAFVVLVWWMSSRAEEETIAPPRAVTPAVPGSSNTPDDRLGARGAGTTATGVADVTTPRRPDDDSATLAALVDAGLSRADGGDDAQARAAVEAWLARNAALAEKTVDAFCDFSKRLAKTPGLEPPTRERDAAAFLAGRADWESGHTGLLHLPASLTDRMKQPPGAWMRFGPADYAGLDFSWMRELLAFDHWTLMSVGPLRDGRDVPAFEQLIPNFVTMQQWAKLRLVKGLHEHALAQASVEVRHLASVCGATSTLIGEMIRLSILLFEREFFEANGLPLLDGTITPQTKQDARAAGFAAHQFLLTGVPTAVKQKALACSPMRCTAMVEAAALLSGLRGAVPRVRDDLDWLKAQKPCEPALFERLATSPLLSSLPTVDALEHDGLERVLREMVDGGSF
ncbi:MAG: hypothetical protein Q8L14_15890 [Myxococcales bacterium]|nr:hypothetical protein [Myxococcales bacterium]